MSRQWRYWFQSFCISGCVALNLLMIIGTFCTPELRGVHGQAALDQPKEGTLKLEPFAIPLEGKSIEGELGRLTVRENRSKPQSNLIEIAFVRLKGTTDRPGYPIVYLDGGPGSSAINIARIPDYMRAFLILREVGDVILLDQRGVGRSKPNLFRISSVALPRDVFAYEEIALKAIREQIKTNADYFRSQGVDLLAYNTVESAHDIDDVRKALGVEKLNLVGFSYGTHLGLACIRYHGPNLERVVLVGTEGQNFTNKLPFTSDKAFERLAQMAANAPELKGQVPDLVGTLRRILARLEKEPLTLTIMDATGQKPLDIKVGKFGFQFLLSRDLGDSNDLPYFPAGLHQIDKGDYSMLKALAEKRYNQFRVGISLMTIMMDASSGSTKSRTAQIQREAKTALLGNAMNFPFEGIGDLIGNPDLGDEYRSPIHTAITTLFVSGTLDNNTPPFQADDVRRTFKNSTHLIVENAGHESMLDNSQVQQAIANFLRGQNVSQVRLALSPLKFAPIPENTTTPR